MTQILVASTVFGAMSLAAAMDAGLLGSRDQRRILLVSNNASAPEVVPPLTEAPGFEALRGHVDEVLSWNELLWPIHPSTWSPRNQDRPLIARLLRRYWNLEDGEPIHLVVESIQVPPARALAAVFDDAHITVYSDGLMSYGPSRESPPREMATRIDRLLYLDLVRGLEPLQLTEYPEVERIAIPADAFRGVVKEVAALAGEDATPPRDDLSGAPLIIGQYLADLEFLSPQEEDELHARMLHGVAGQGHRTVLFKPHPSSSRRTFRALRRCAVGCDVDLVVLDTPLPVEVWYETLSPALVVGCFSTGLTTAASFYGVPVATVGSELLLSRVAPYQNSNRIPITLADTLLPQLQETGEVLAPRIPDERVTEELTPLLAAVSYCMQNSTYPHLRDEAIAYLNDQPSDVTTRYFKRRRLTALRLPGAVQRRYPDWLVAGARKIRGRG